MTRILFSTLLYLWITTLLNGQSTQSFPLPASLKQQIVTALAPLDKTQVPGGYLLNQTTPFVSPTLFNGQVTDTTPLNVEQFTLLYNQFRSCYVGSGSNLPDPNIALMPSIVETTDDTVQIGRLAIHYSMIRNDALTANLLQEVNGQYFDVVGRQESPYIGLVCLAAIAIEREVTTLNPVFTFPSTLAFANVSLNGADWQIDVSDGTGFHPISAINSYSAAYTTDGVKKIQFKMSYQQVDYYMYSVIRVNASTNNISFATGGGGNQYSPRPDETIYLTADKAFQGPDEITPSRNSVRLDIFYACEDRKLRKPIIFVGGYENPRMSENLDNDWRSGLMERIRKDFTDPMETIPPVTLIDGNTTMEESLKAAGYDLIYVDWANGMIQIPLAQPFPGLPNGDDYIQRNAFAIEKVLHWVNDKKKSALSDHENILIGGSMGGLVCKYALLDMQRNGEKHECRVFITYDSPLTGANIPLGTQAAFRWLGYMAHDLFSVPGIGGLGSVLPQNAEVALASLDRPAFRQMVIQSCRKVGNNLTIVRSPEYTALMAEIAAMGTLNIEHIAVTNGSNPNVLLENETGPGGLLTNFDIIYETKVAGGISINTIFGSLYIPLAGATNTTFFGMKIRAEGNFTPTELFAGYFGTKLLGIGITFPLTLTPPVGSYFSMPANGTEIPLSTIPGGNSVLGVIPNFLPFVITDTPLPSEQYNPNPMAPGISNGVGTGLHAMINSNFGSTNQNNLFSGWFRAVHGGFLLVNSPLALHCTFIPSFSALSLPLPTAPPVSGAVMPCSSPVDRCSSPTAVWMNPNNSMPEFNQDHVFLDDRIANLLLEVAEPGLVNSSLLLPPNLTTYFNAALSSQKDIGGISIKSVGKLSINNNGAAGFGGPNQPQAATNPFTAYLGGCYGTTLTVENGGKLFIGADNQDRTGHVIARKNSLVHLHKGSNLTALGSGSSLTIDKTSTLIIDKDAVVDLKPFNSKIRIEGTLRVNGDFKFLGNGYFEFGPEAKLEYGPSVQEWTLGGRGKGLRFMRLEGSLRIPVGRGLVLENGLVQHQIKGVFEASANASLTGIGVVFDGQETAIAGLKASFAAKIWMSNCDYLTFDDAITADFTPNVNIINCNFLGNRSYGLKHDGAGMTVNILRSTFDGALPGGIGTVGTSGAIFVHTETVRIYDSYFKNMNEDADYSDGIQVIDKRGSVMASEYAGVRLANVRICDVKRSYFLHNDVGIHNPEFINPETQVASLMPSNVFVDKSYFTGNGAGIFMYGDANGGAVISTCCSYYDNNFGIAGNDCRLGIDAFNNASDPGAVIRSNSFVIYAPSAASLIGKWYLSMCHDVTNPITLGSHLIRGNYWSQGFGPDPDPLKRIQISFGCDVNIPAIRYMPVVTSSNVGEFCKLAEFSNDPVDYVGGYDDSECEVNTSLAGSPYMHNQYALAYYHLIVNENISEALPLYEEMAGHYTDESFTSYPDNCRQFVSIGWSIIHGIKQQDFLRSSPEHAKPKAAPEAFTIYPNPVSGLATMSLPGYACRIEVTDLHGKVIRTLEATQSATLDVQNMQSGFYLIRCTAADGSTSSITRKMVVQKL